MWPFDKDNKIKDDKTECNNDKEKNYKSLKKKEAKHDISAKEKDYEKLKLSTLKEFDIKVDQMMSEHKIWLEQYQRNIKTITENYDRRIEEFENKINLVRETLEKNIDARKDIIENLNEILDFDKVFKYQTTGIITLPDDVDLRRLDGGNWEIIILAKKIN